MLLSFRVLTVWVVAVLLVSCVVGPRVPAGTPCNAANFSVIDNFSGARRGSCTVTGDSSVRLVNLREDNLVKNPSPWYAFKLVPNEQGIAEIVLDYRPWKHRYLPKISNDGRTWRLLDDDLTKVSAHKHRATLRVPLNDQPVWISAQELITPAVHDAWNRNITDNHGIGLTELGRSRKNQPIHVFDSNPDAKDVILLVGRQHPPEVSGAFAFYAFVEVLFGDSDLATAFRERFRIIAVPLMNPDGVIGGNWRHNLGGVDLNRDWGPFTQPETRLIANLLDDLDNNGSRLRLFVDFHSTNRNLFYTQDDSSPTSPPGFTRTWLENSAPRLDDYPFTNEARPTSDTANGKNYMYKRYGIPSMTYEVGDETDRNAARDAARVFAEEMMQLMFDQGY